MSQTDWPAPLHPAKAPAPINKTPRINVKLRFGHRITASPSIPAPGPVLQTRNLNILIVVHLQICFLA
jgi:hypothetical protein